MPLHILLSTYNGEKYLDDLINSILKQTYKDFVLLVRDDGSTDSTVEKLKKYSLQFPEKIKLCFDAEKLGAARSFLKLINVSSSDYIMFCDQDDVWKPTKVEDTSNLFFEMEHKYGCELPLLVHTDLEVVDAELNTISYSFFEKQKLSLDFKIEKLIYSNSVTGCTVMINRALVNYTDTSSDIVMHDWYLALIAAKYGNIAFLPLSTILYRQHDSNTIGAKKINIFTVIAKLSNPSSLFASYKQAKMFANVGFIKFFFKKGFSYLHRVLYV